MTDEAHLYQTLSDQRDDLLNELIGCDHAVSEISKGNFKDPLETIDKLCKYYSESVELAQKLGEVEVLLEGLDHRLKDRENHRQRVWDAQKDPTSDSAKRSGEWFKNANYRARPSTAALSIAMRQHKRMEEAEAQKLFVRTSAMKMPVPAISVGESDIETHQAVAEDMRSRYDRTK